MFTFSNLNPDVNKYYICNNGEYSESCFYNHRYQYYDYPV